MAARVYSRAYLQKKLIDSIESECYKRAKVALHIGFVRQRTTIFGEGQ